jgi:hypothetical protein
MEEFDMPGKKNEKKTENNVDIIERPRICCLDLDDDVISALEKSGANIYNGSLGSKVRVQNTSANIKHNVLLNHNFPPNIQEYDIFLMDLNNYKTVDYDKDAHTKKTHTGKSSCYFLSTYPETLFDPLPFSSHMLGAQLEQIRDRQILIVVFSSKQYNVKYQAISIEEGGNSRTNMGEYNIYSFWQYIPFSEVRHGEEITLGSMRDDFKSLLEKNLKGATYNQTFFHPTIRKDGEDVKNRCYVPLMTNLNGEIISYFELKDDKRLYILPQIKDNAGFLLDFLSTFAPSMHPDLFPFSTNFIWKKQEDYWLPNHSELLKVKSDIQEEFDNKIIDSQKKIKENLDEFSFLHEILSETGDALVKPLIKFLKWLEFDTVIDCDERKTDTTVLEEDIQVELADGLLIIECKGIGGTSTDADCSQISKIKHRRCRERNDFDVKALYVVNHQRYLPPLSRNNPPFTEHQIQDAINDERGLLTTWQLFNLYADIESGIISKEDARKAILEFGLIAFRPQNLTLVGEPTELMKKGKICIVNVDGLTLKEGDKLFVEKQGRFSKVEIIDIQIDSKPVKTASKGELGLNLSSSIKKNSKLWKKSI